MLRTLSILFFTPACFTAAVSLWGAKETPPDRETAEIHLKECRILLDDERQLATGQSGVVSKVYVREGDRVQAGDPLVQLDAAIPKASLAVAAKEAENDVDVRFARKAAEVAATEYDLAMAANREQEQTFSDIEIEKLRLEKDRSKLQIEVAEHQLKVAQLKQEEAKAVVDSYQIAAPIDGLITRIYQKPGEAVTSGNPVVEMKKSSIVRIEADLGVEHLSDVKPGARVQVVPAFFPREREAEEKLPEGKIFFVDVSADPVSRTVRVLAEVDNRQGWLIPGLQAELIIFPSDLMDDDPPDVSTKSTETP